MTSQEVNYSFFSPHTFHSATLKEIEFGRSSKLDVEERRESDGKTTHSNNRWLTSSFLITITTVFIITTLVKFSSTSTISWSPISQQFSTSSTRSKADGNILIQTKDNKPNIILIVIDDLGYGSLGYNKNDLTSSTPFMTSMIQDGIMLTNFYMNELCTPSRGALLTGRYPIHIGLQLEVTTCNNHVAVNLDETLLPEILRDYGGYSSYGIGKWHIGHYTPAHLPTARGFDHYFGFLAGGEYYWSKYDNHCGDSNYYGLLDMNTTCYSVYKGNNGISDDTGSKASSSSDSSSASGSIYSDDFGKYSTHLFADRAIDIIQSHFNISTTSATTIVSPMYLYIGFQAVHDPFTGDPLYPDGLPSTFFDNEVYEAIINSVVENDIQRQQVALSLRLLDDSINKIIVTLNDLKQLDNSYIIVTSDNGGCVSSGGRNGGLRGMKGTLYEGGNKVDAFIYSPLLPDATKGTNYTALMHVTDWLPTILDFANVSYTPKDGYELDGISHSTAISALGTNKIVDDSRDYMLYNMYYNVSWYNSSYQEWPTTVQFAVRNSRYKLMNHDNESVFTETYYVNENYSNVSGTCHQISSPTNLVLQLYDLWFDPSETTNLYNDPNYENVQNELWDYVTNIMLSTKKMIDLKPADFAFDVFVEADNYIVPWDIYSEYFTSTSLRYCDDVA